MEALQILTDPDIELFVEKHLLDDPAQIALRFRDNEFPASLVSNRIKYLQKARGKLPVFFDRRCFFLPKAYEQCSSQEAASLKRMSGQRVLDLTCGLGVDTWHWSSQFEQVVALEPDPVLFPVLSENIKRLGLNNVLLHQMTAEQFIAGYQGPAFDLIYADPDRREADGQRIHDPRRGSPDIPALWPALSNIGQTLMVKLSPMVEVRELDRLFPQVSRRIILSVNGECKEVLVECNLHSQPSHIQDELWISRKGRQWHLQVDSHEEVPSQPLSPSAIRILAEPDVAAYKGHCLARFMAAGPWKQDWYGCGPHHFFATDKDPEHVFPGRILAVEDMFPYSPKVIRKALKLKGISRLDISRRGFPFSVQQIRQSLKIREGGPWQLWCTEINGHRFGFLGKERFTDQE